MPTVAQVLNDMQDRSQERPVRLLTGKLTSGPPWRVQVPGGSVIECVALLHVSGLAPGQTVVVAISPHLTLILGRLT